MPTSVTAPMSSSNKPANPSMTRGAPQSRKRVIRRRGRARGDVDSDDEVERAVMSDDSDSGSLPDSDDSDSESASDSLQNGQHHIKTPNTTQSPPPEIVSSALGIAAAKSEPANELPTAFLSAGIDWSDIVTHEQKSGIATLPVIDFAEMRVDIGLQSQEISGSPPHETTPSATEKPTGTLASGPESASVREQRRSTGPTRAAGQTARQAYQQRLQNDPSFVPVVGDFWGHDDRLMDKNMRSLSPWWRGRWQNRGRGRGGFAPRGGPRYHGQGDYGADGSTAPQGRQEAALHSNHESCNEAIERRQVPPIEKIWTHDGFEEMRTKEASRRAAQQERTQEHHQQQPQRPFSPNVRGGRGGFVPTRGRGGFAPGRGGFVAPIRGRGGAAFGARFGSDRPWFAMKPERMWTKQHEGFLHLDPALKIKHGQPPLIRVNLPGKTTVVVKAEAVATPRQLRPVISQREGSDHGKSFAVRLPKKSTKATEPNAPISPAGEDIPFESFMTMEQPSLDAETIRSPAKTAVSIPEPPEPLVRSQPVAGPSHQSDDSSATGSCVQVTPIADQEQFSVDAATPSLDSEDSQQIAGERPASLQLPLLQTVFPPPPLNTSPAYNSPYGYAPQLPPGIAYSQQGFAYEVATGRPVYLHPTPPPLPLYTPRPISHPHGSQHGVPFVPGHMHHPSSISSMSPDFLAQSHTPPLNGFVDPSTGAPIFSLPRQSSRVEIRAPSDQAEAKGKTERKPSGLRSAVSAQPFRPAQMNHQHQLYTPAVEYFSAAAGGAPSAYPSSENSGGDEMTQQHPMDPGVMGYGPSYPPQYYYPEHYSYPPYVDMTQGGQFDSYSSDPRQHHPSPVYY